jgi:hypothetical protein
MPWMRVGTAEFVGSTGQGTATLDSRFDFGLISRLGVTSEPGGRQ